MTKLLSLALVVSLASCQKTHYQLRAPGAPLAESIVYRSRLHVSLINLVEVSSPVDIAAACAGGADAMFEEVSPLGIVINVLVGSIIPVLSVRNVTGGCAMAGFGGPPAPAAPAGP